MPYPALVTALMDDMLELEIRQRLPLPGLTAATEYRVQDEGLAVGYTLSWRGTSCFQQMFCLKEHCGHQGFIGCLDAFCSPSPAGYYGCPPASLVCYSLTIAQLSRQPAPASLHELQDIINLGIGRYSGQRFALDGMLHCALPTFLHAALAWAVEPISEKLRAKGLALFPSMQSPLSLDLYQAASAPAGRIGSVDLFRVEYQQLSSEVPKFVSRVELLPEWESISQSTSLAEALLLAICP